MQQSKRPLDWILEESGIQKVLGQNNVLRKGLSKGDKGT
jgi:hypothetical protein